VRTVQVELGERSYDVVVGAGAVGALGDLLPAGARRAAVVTQEGIGFDVDPDLETNTTSIPDGEAGKTMATVEELCRTWSRWGLTRNDVVIGVGGGVVTDVAGFAASVYHRGAAVVHVPTTLLGMVDAAIGGKTGVNLPEGKNLVGAFWQPSGVVCDLDALATLPPRELRSGHGELAKYHFLSDDDLDSMDLEERVAAAVTIKADVVASDERESSLPAHDGPQRGRAILNYGHTLAHALETSGDHELRHGEAVAVGLIYAALLARRLGRIDDGRVDEHRTVVGGYDLPQAPPPGADADALVALMARDKKAIDGLTFVLDGPDGVEVVHDVPEAEVRAALAELLAGKLVRP
jgi:5-deoxy-5-amino-3-dehydroquinate synthase